MLECPISTQSVLNFKYPENGYKYDKDGAQCRVTAVVIKYGRQSKLEYPQITNLKNVLLQNLVEKYMKVNCNH